jgi:hypothetical protein
MSPEAALIARTKMSKAMLGIWHRQLGHISLDAVKRLLRHKMVTGMDISSDDTSRSTCIPCLEGKQTRDEILKESSTKHPRILHRIYSDLCGPMQTQSHHGELYILTFIDGNTHYVKVKLLKSKAATCAALKALIKRAEVETGERVNYFRSDGGGEYGSKELATYFESKGIHHERTNTYTPQENGVAEWMNRTIVEMAQTFLQDAGLPNTHWSFAVNHATYVINRTPTRTLKQPITPFEAYTGNKPSVAHLQIFGCKGYVHVPHEKRQKLDKKTLECTHLGYSEHKRAFILIHRSSGRIVESWDVHFDKSELVEPTRVRIETEIRSATRPVSSPKGSRRSKASTRQWHRYFHRYHLVYLYLSLEGYVSVLSQIIHRYIQIHPWIYSGICNNLQLGSYDYCTTTSICYKVLSVLKASAAPTLPAHHPIMPLLLNLRLIPIPSITKSPNTKGHMLT